MFAPHAKPKVWGLSSFKIAAIARSVDCSVAKVAQVDLVVFCGLFVLADIALNVIVYIVVQIS